MPLLMKKHILISYLYVLSIFSLGAQANMAGINYQALVQDKAGKAVLNAPLKVQIALVAENKSTPAYFSEVHQLTSDFLGQISLVIGQGQATKGKLADVPWGTEQIWLDIQVEHTNGGTPLNINSHNRLLSVPYALYAATATQLDEDLSALEKTQSIYWTTSGNTATNPDVHFLGTRDSQNLVIKTFNQPIVTFDMKGQTQIIGRKSGKDTDETVYPLHISGSNQGIHIKVNGERNGDNNFITFADDQTIQGRIEGQTKSELYEDWEFKLDTKKLDQELAFAITQAALSAAKTVALASSVFAVPAAVGRGEIAAEFAIIALEYAAKKLEFELRALADLGVTYQSGAGDYAEWLKRKPEERNLHFGEVVGVKGGNVSLVTQGADQVLVISKNPAVVGNAPSDLTTRKNFERVAFLGQVPVKVAGPVEIGDYIIPSGNNDGYGVAVHPQDMQSGDFAQAVGVAWEAAPDHLLNYVKVAIGINTNDLSHKVDQLLQNIENIMAHLEGKEPLLSEAQLNQRAKSIPDQSQTSFSKLVSDEYFDQFIDQYQKELKEAGTQVQLQLQKSAYDFSNDPSIVALLSDPGQVLKQMRRDPSLVTQWALFDKRMAPFLSSSKK